MGHKTNIGQDLINRIVTQTRFPLTAWNSDCLGVFLFSAKTGTASERFSRVATDLLSNQSGLFIAPLLQESLNQIISNIQEQKAQHTLPTTAKIAVRIIVAADEEANLDLPKKSSKQVVRLITDEKQAVNREAFYILDDKHDKGLENLFIYSYLQGLIYGSAQEEKGILIDGSMDSQVRNAWIHKLRTVLDKSLHVSSGVSVKEIESEVDNSLISRMEMFRDELLPPFPAMDEFPLDEDGINELISPSNSNGFAGMFKKLSTRRQEVQRFDLQESLTKLYGKTDDEELRIRDSYIDIFNEQKIDRFFEDTWSPSNAWYYRIPLNWLLDNLGTRIMKRLSAAQERFEQLKENALQHKIVSIEPTLEKLCAKLGDEYGFSKLYKCYAEIWYWNRALSEVQHGSFHTNATEAKSRIEAQLTVLRNSPGGTGTISDGTSDIDWNNDIATHIDKYKPAAEYWKPGTIESYLKNNCNWDSLDYSSSGGVLYCAIKCPDTKQRSKIMDLSVQSIKNVGSFTTKWGFGDEMPSQGILVIAVVPISFISDEAAKGGAVS